MIDYKDRVPTKPNMMLITPQNGTPYKAKIEYADEPTEAGTPINKAVFYDIQQQLLIADNCTTTFNTDGSITQVFDLYRLVTSFPSKTQVVEKMYRIANNTLLATKTTTFTDTGITEVIV